MIGFIEEFVVVIVVDWFEGLVVVFRGVVD